MTMRFNSLQRLVLVASLCVGVSGCAEPTGWVPGIKSTPTGTEVYEHRVYVGPCVITQPSEQQAAEIAAELGGLLVKELAGVAVKTFAELLQEAGREQIWKVSDVRLAVFDEKGPQCVQVIRGKFEALPPEAPRNLGLPLLGDEQYERIRATGIWLAEAPDIFLEFQAVRAPGAIGFQMDYIYYGKAFRPLTVGRDSSAAVAVEIALRGPGVAKGPDGAPVAQIVIGSIATPHAFLYLSPTAAGASPTGESSTDPSFMLPKQTAWMVLAPQTGETGSLVRAVDVTLVETDPGSRFLTNLGTALAGLEQPVETAVGQVVVPSEREQAEAADRTALQNAITTFYTQYAAAERAIGACQAARDANAPDRRALCVTAQGEQRVANILAKPAGIGQPYPELIQP